MRRTWLIGIAAVVVLALAGGYFFATGGMPGREAPLWLTEEPFAHRGLHSAEHPENSMGAFIAALDAGHPIELDVHLTSDGHVVVVHDNDLERLAGDPREVSDVTLAELRQMRILGSEESFPTLSEVLLEVNGRQPVLIEVKNPDEVGALEDGVVEELEGYTGEVAIMSFNPYSVGRFAEVAPDLTRGQLSGTFEGEDLPAWQIFALRNLLMNWASKPDYVAYELPALPNVDARLQRLRGRPLLAWTPETAAERERGLEVADNVICNPGGLPQ